MERAFENIDQFAERWIGELNVPGLAIAMTDRRKLLKTFTYGVADVATQTPVTRDTMFEIGSLGKPFTNIALLQLRDEGTLDLKAPVDRYLPWFRVQSDYPPIQVHHLMNHTAGIVRGTDIAPHGLYEAWALRETRTGAAPGAYFAYSNVGYKCLGFLLERITGQTLDQAIRSRVLEPLGMTNTHAVVTHATRKAASTGYCGFYDDRPWHRSHEVVPAGWAELGTADGCAASSAGDMAIYARMLLNRGQGVRRRLMSEESFNLMTLNGISSRGASYGYGLAIYPAGGATYIGHGGGTDAYRSALVVDMKAGLGVVLLLNRTGETDPIVDAAQQALAVLRAGHRRKPLPALPPPVDPRSVKNAKEYAGPYRSGRRQLRLTAERGKLLLKYRGRKIALELRAPDRFYVDHPDFDLFLLEFTREKGRVVEAFHGPRWYTHERYSGPRSFDYPAEWEAYSGHYRTRRPEPSNFRIVLRKGALALSHPWGHTYPLIPLGPALFRIGDDSRSPETLQFHAVVDGRALRVDYSRCPYYRTFTP